MSSSSQPIESLEARKLLSSTPVNLQSMFNLAAAGGPESPVADAAPSATLAPAAAKGTKAAKRNAPKLDRAKTTALAVSDVQNIIAAGVSQMRPTQAVAVTDRSGNLLGLYLGSGLNPAELNDPNPFNTFTGGVVLRAVQRARTAAAFQSRGEAFTTRTARFIILNQFPQPIKNQGGGPLYGVEISQLLGGDIEPLAYQTPLFSGDPGGVPLYIRGVPVGGVGVAGDMNDTLPQQSPTLNILANDVYGKAANPNRRVFSGNEDADFDESVAITAARAYRAPQEIRATRIFVGGLRFPYTASKKANKNPAVPFDQLTTTIGGGLAPTNVLSITRLGLTAANAPTGLRAGNPERINGNVAGLPGLFRITDNLNPQEGLAIDPSTGRLVGTGSLGAGTVHQDIQESDPVHGSNDVDANGNPLADRLTSDDVMQVIEDAVRQSQIVRAGIRKPNGVRARVHVIVVDRDGDVLGAFREEDATNFSYDVAVQKARTAAYFSDDQHAFTATAIGFMSQRSFPTGLANGVRGPLLDLQDKLSISFPDYLTGNIFGLGRNINRTNQLTDPDQPGRFQRFPLSNGQIIFPGGAPLYKNGILVGAVGISGDGVTQDDLITYGGTLHFRPDKGDNVVRADQMSGDEVADYILNKVRVLETATAGTPLPNTIQAMQGDPAPGVPGYTLQEASTSTGSLVLGRQPSEIAADTIRQNRDVQLPYLKFPRNPFV